MRAGFGPRHRIEDGRWFIEPDGFDLPPGARHRRRTAWGSSIQISLRARCTAKLASQPDTSTPRQRVVYEQDRVFACLAYAI
jgi:hypothetical protein